LVLSVVTNVFLLGFVARNNGIISGAGILAGSAGQAYPAEVRAEFRNLLRENRLRTVAALRDLRQARQALAAAVNADPLNEAEVERTMEDVRQATEGLQRLMQQYLLSALKRTHRAEQQI